MKLLWIDDDVANLDAQQRYLERAGFNVEALDNVDDAWARIQRGDAPAIILDIMMATGKLLKDTPTDGGLITGEQFLLRLRDQGKLKGLKIIIYTITNNESSRKLAEELGIRFYTKQSDPGKALAEIAKREFLES